MDESRTPEEELSIILSSLENRLKSAKEHASSYQDDADIQTIKAKDLSKRVKQFQTALKKLTK